MYMYNINSGRHTNAFSTLLSLMLKCKKKYRQSKVKSTPYIILYLVTVRRQTPNQYRNRAEHLAIFIISCRLILWSRPRATRTWWRETTWTKWRTAASSATWATPTQRWTYSVSRHRTSPGKKFAARYSIQRYIHRCRDRIEIRKITLCCEYLTPSVAILNVFVSIEISLYRLIV